MQMIPVVVEKVARVPASFFAPITAQTRSFTFMIAAVVCLLVVFVSVFSPLIVFRNKDAAYASQTPRLEYGLATDCGQTMRGVLINGIAVTRVIEGYVLSRMTKLPNMSGTAAERASGQNFPNFKAVARTALFDNAGVDIVTLQPGGVLTDAYPEGSRPLGRDVFAPDDCSQLYDPTPQYTMQHVNFGYVGPYLSCVSPVEGEWSIAIRRPIYNTTDYEQAGLHNFWGFATVVIDIGDLVKRHPLIDQRLVEESGIGPIDYMLSVRQSRPFGVGVVATSLGDVTDEQATAFINLGSSVNVTPNHPFTVTIRGREYGGHMSPTNITLAIACVLFSDFLLLAITMAIVLWCAREYDAARYAPKMAPFAMLTIGPCRGEQLWDSAPEEMAEVVTRLEEVLQRRMVCHHAYPIQQVHPLTTSYVTRSVAAAVQMAFDAIEQLQRHPIDAPLRAALGDADGRLLLSFAVHWCTDAAVRVESLQGSYRYEGPDVVFGGRMWAFAAPGVVTASAAVVAALPRFGLRCVAARPHRVVHVVRSRTRCGATDATGTTADTIYVPPPAPTAVQATAVWDRRCSATLAVFGVSDSVDGHSDDAQPLPTQPLFTLMDARRPALLAAEAAAPRNVDGFGAVPELRGVQRKSLTLVDVPATVAAPAVVPGATLGDPYVSTGSFASAADDAHGPPSGTDRSLMSPLPAFASSTYTRRTSASPRSPNSGALEGDAVTRALLQPIIPRSLDVALHTAFDYQAITLNMHYMDVRVLVYYFHASYKILFRPLAAPERHNIFRRLVTAFGVPQQGILEHLAARCVLRGLQRGIKEQHAATHPPQPLKQRLPTTLPPALAAFTETPKDAALTRKAGRK